MIKCLVVTTCVLLVRLKSRRNGKICPKWKTCVELVAKQAQPSQLHSQFKKILMVVPPLTVKTKPIPSLATTILKIQPINHWGVIPKHPHNQPLHKTITIHRLSQLSHNHCKVGVLTRVKMKLNAGKQRMLWVGGREGWFAIIDLSLSLALTSCLNNHSLVVISALKDVLGEIIQKMTNQLQLYDVLSNDPLGRTFSFSSVEWTPHNRESRSHLIWQSIPFTSFMNKEDSSVRSRVKFSNQKCECRIDEMRWDEMRWDEMRWDKMKWWDEMKWDEMRWDEMKWDEMR